MKIPRKNFKLRSIILFGLVISSIIACFVYLKNSSSLFSYAVTQHLSASIIGDDGLVDFSPSISNAVVKFSYSRSGTLSADSNIYDAKIVVQDLPTNQPNKVLSIKLPIGMNWVDDASTDENLIPQLNGDVERVSIGQTVLNYSFPNSGERIYHLQDNSVSFTVNIRIKADRFINLTYIEDAIVAKLSYGGVTEVAKIDVDVPTGAAQNGRFPTTSRTKYVAIGEHFSGNQDHIKTIRANFLAGQYSQSRLITQIKVHFEVSDPRVTIELNKPDSIYSLDSSNSATGKYDLLINFKSYSTADMTLPYTIVFPDTLSPGDEITITANAETTYWQPGDSTITVPFRANQNIVYHVLDNVEDVTIGWSSLSPSNTGTVNDLTVSSAVEEGDGVIGALAYGFINNRGGVDSNSKTAVITFDTSILGVMALKLPCSPGGSIHTVSVVTSRNNSKNVDVDLACNDYGISSVVTFASLGIDKDEYISKITYELGVIPKATQLRQAAQSDGNIGLLVIGRRLDQSATGEITFEVFDSDNESNTTGIAKITSYFSRSSSLYVSSSSSQVKDAGETLNFTSSISTRPGVSTSYRYVVKNPIIYIRSEARDANGNFLPISNIKITNGPLRGNQDITSLFGQITYEDTDTARVYKIDSRGITDGSASVSGHYISDDGSYEYSTLTLSFSIETSLSTPDQIHNIADMVFVQDPGIENLDVDINTNAVRGNPYGLGTGTNRNTVYAASHNYYQIRGHQSIGVENSGKHPDSNSWFTWAEGSSPISIGLTDSSLIDMKASFLNNSGVNVPGPTTLYLPIPKKGENWGTLSYNNQSFSYSTVLTGTISNPNSNYFTIAYGRNVTPTDDGAELNSEDTKFTTNTAGWTASDWGKVNCVKIIATNIPTNESNSANIYDFTYILKLSGITDEYLGFINTWRPLYYQHLTNSAGDVFAGWYKGGYVSIELSDGKISGQLFIDSNENGKWDENDPVLQESGWELELYDRSSNRLIRSTETNSNGAYSFTDISIDSNKYYLTITNKHPIGNTGTTYLFTSKGSASGSNGYNTDNQAVGSTESNPFHANAYIDSIYPSRNANEATYNIGLVEYATTSTYSGQVVFVDEDNQFNTRPDVVSIQIESDNNETIAVDVPTDGSGIWERVLTKYNNNMERINYSFSADDFPNYSKDATFDQDSLTYSLVYTQKKATLNVHHYAVGTEMELADSLVSPVYWGQPYSTEKKELTNYEFDSVVGDPSGVISGDTSVIYYYKLRRGTIVTHYYILDTNTSISPDTSVEYNYTDTYMTSPLEIIPDEYAYYELVSEKPEGYTGIVEAPNLDVIYYYKKKDPSLSFTVHLAGPDSIDYPFDYIPYTVEYSSHIEDYSGEVTITLLDKLPFPIDLSLSDLDGGIYDDFTNTITWNESFSLSTYIDGNDIEKKYELKLVYLGVLPGNVFSNSIKGNINLSDKSSSSTDSLSTKVPDHDLKIPDTGQFVSASDTSSVNNIVVIIIALVVSPLFLAIFVHLLKNLINRLYE